MKKIVIVGAGASGVFLSLNLKDKNNEVIVLEKNEEPLKKILVTGNGRCNYFNMDQDLKHYHSTSLNNINYLLKENDINRSIEIFNDLGIYPRIINGYYYPFSNNAKTIRNTFIEEMNNKNIKLITNYEVKKIRKIDDKFIINDDIKCDYLIISTGSKSGINEEYNMYNLLEKMNIKIIKPLPSLTKLVVDNKYLKKLNGIRTLANCKILVNNKLLKEEYGELQLTDYGLSGIVIFNLSRYASISLDKKQTVSVKVNFLPTFENIDEIFERNKNIRSALKRILNDKLVDVILSECGVNDNFDKLNDIEKNKLKKYLTEYEFKVKDVKPFISSQVSIGGVSLEEINLNTLESLKIPNLFFTGEVLDVDGDCGGYNLTFSWTSALIVSRSIRGKK